MLDYDIVLNLTYVQPKSNPSDEPSRSVQNSDPMLSADAWGVVLERFGGHNGHSLDLMSLDSICMKDSSGNLN